MAITLDTFAHGESDATTTTVGITVGDNSNKILVVLITTQSTPGGEVDSVTWNTNESLTYITGSYGDNGDEQSTEAWYLVNPTSTTANLVVDYIDATSPPANVNCWSLYDVDQADPIGAVDILSDTDGSSPIQNSITTEANNSWVLQAYASGGTTNDRYTANSGQTERFDGLGGSSAYQAWAADLFVATAGATDVDIVDDIDDGDWSHQTVVEIKVVAGGEEYTMGVTVGGFVLTGIAALFERMWAMAVSVGSFVLTGITTGLLRPIINMVVSVGEFTLTGISVILGRVLNMIVSVGEFTLTGINNILTSARTIAVSVGEFTLTGINVVLTKALNITASLGEFTLTGISNILTSARTITASVGEFTLTGISATFEVAARVFTLVAEVGKFILTGSSAVFSGLWTKMSKNTTSWTGGTKHTTDYTGATKHTTDYTNATKDTSDWTNQDKNTTTFTNKSKS